MSEPPKDLAKPSWGCGCVFIILALLGLGYWAIIWLSNQTS